MANVEAAKADIYMNYDLSSKTLCPIMRLNYLS